MERKPRARRNTAPGRLKHAATAAAPWPNVAALIETGGQITIGAIYPIECAIAASEADNVLVMLQRRDGETLTQMLDRLDACIAEVWDTEKPIDEINAPR